jgi:hypothetical protein
MQNRWKSRVTPPWRWHLVLALVMLLMQQAGLRHSLQHALHDDGAPTHAACVVCLAHHANDLGATHSVPTLVLAAVDHVLTADAAQGQRGHCVQTGYLPRAPPALSV